METVFSNCMGGRTKEDAVETGTEGVVAEFDATDGAAIALDLFLAGNGQYQNSITGSTSNGDRGGNDDEGHASKDVSNMLMGVRVCGVLYHVMYSMVTRRIGQHGREGWNDKIFHAPWLIELEGKGKVQGKREGKGGKEKKNRGQ